MCGRFNATSDPLARLFMDVAEVPFEFDDRYNIAPTDRAPVLVRGNTGIAPVDMQWWLVPHWSKEPRTRYATFNARAENLDKSAVFRTPFERRRCLVPVSGFYEWLREGKRKQPWYLRYEGGSGMLLAGLWDRWRGPDGDLYSFAVVTTEVHPQLAFIHNRQPVMLDRAGAELWLDRQAERGALQALFEPALPEPLAVVPVSTHVNNARNKDPGCLVAVGEPRHVPASR